MSKVTVFLDYDDVIVDWATPACNTFNLDLNDPEVRTQIEEIWGGIDKWVPDDMLWGKIHELGMDWWADLPILPWARPLYDGISAIPDVKVMFLTAPSDHWSCFAGKQVSIKKHFGTRDFYIGKPKEEAARKDRILVDDRPSNCEKFVGNQGQAFQWPNAVKLLRVGGWERMVDRAVDFVKEVQHHVKSGSNFSFHCIPELVDVE